MTGQRRRRAWQWPLVAVPALAALLFSSQPASPVTPASAKPNTLTGGSGDNGNGKNQGGGNDKKDFTIAGDVAGLYPGSSKALVVTLTNQNNFDIRVTSLSATVADPAGPCTAGVVRVDPLAGTVVVPKNGTATTTLTARMSDDPSNDCKSTSFGLTYTGTAVKA
jgi:hypothetical protein